MKLLLVSDGMHSFLSDFSTRKIEFINQNSLGLKDLQNFLQNATSSMEGVLITDEAFSEDLQQDLHHLNFLLQWLSHHDLSLIPVIIITQDFHKVTALQSLAKMHKQIQIMTCDYIRIPIRLYKQAFEQCCSQPLPDGRNQTSTKKTSFLDRFKPKPKPKEQAELQATDELSKQLAQISRSMSKVVAITGHRGSGLTSTAVNVAQEASKRGLRVMIIDMDIEYRSMNMYFSSFHEQTKRDEEMNASLIRTLARPQDYSLTAFHVNNDLWMTSLGYGFTDQKLLNQFFQSHKLISLLSMLRGKFNLIILDMPLDLFRTFNDSLIHIDIFGLCVPNNLYSILSTLKNIENILDRDDASHLNAKSKVIVTKYNDRAKFQNEIFTPQMVSEVLSSGLSDFITYEMKVAGHIPYNHEFDGQIESDVPIVHSSSEFGRSFGNILLRLMEGVS